MIQIIFHNNKENYTRKDTTCIVCFKVFYAKEFLELFLNNSVLKRSSFNSKKSQEFKNVLSSLAGINTQLSGKKKFTGILYS